MRILESDRRGNAALQRRDLYNYVSWRFMPTQCREGLAVIQCCLISLPPCINISIFIILKYYCVKTLSHSRSYRTKSIKGWRGALPRSRDLRIPDLKFFSTLFWLGRIGLVSGASSIALPDFIWRKGISFEAMTVHATKLHDRFLTEVLRDFPQS